MGERTERFTFFLLVGQASLPVPYSSGFTIGSCFYRRQPVTIVIANSVKQSQGGWGCNKT